MREKSSGGDLALWFGDKVCKFVYALHQLIIACRVDWISFTLEIANWW